MTALHDELAAGLPSGCKLCSYLNGLSVLEADEWQVELSRPDVAHSNVVKALARRGVDLSEASVRRHRSRHITKYA